MARNESTRRQVKRLEIALGPLRWHSTLIQEAGESAALTKGDLLEQLRALIQQALRQGCNADELRNLIARHSSGEHHVDA